MLPFLLTALLTVLMSQWRYDDVAERWSERIYLSMVRKASVMINLPSAFTILTTDSRQLVFQIRHEPPDSSDESQANSVECDSSPSAACPDAAQWCALLSRLCDLETAEAIQADSSDQGECDTSNDELEDHLGDSMSTELSSKIRQMISDGDVDALDGLLDLETCRESADAEGNSLLLLTLKLCPEVQLTTMIARVALLGVDPNMANEKYADTPNPDSRETLTVPLHVK
jgi:hypothetical protein